MVLPLSTKALDLTPVVVVLADRLGVLLAEVDSRASVEAFKEASGRI